MKKIVSYFLILALAFSLCPAAAAFQSDGALHVSYMGSGSVYGGDNYLYDTLTIAGAGVEAVNTYTVYDLEMIATDSALGLGYENTYSLMTSGKVFSQSLFTGMKLYDLLVYSGLNEALPDSTPVKAVSKDGYTIAFTLGALKDASEYSRYASMTAAAPEETGLPVIIAFGSNGLPLIGPTGTEPVFKEFTEADGYSDDADNVGGPVRLVVGQTEPTEFNAPSCSKWLAAVVVGDADGYEYSRESDAAKDDSEPDMSGDWTHGTSADGYTLTITGSEAETDAVLKISELEVMRDISTREYFACSAGRDAYEGIILRELILKYLSKDLDAPTKVTVISSDGYQKSLDIDSLMNGIDSYYQPGKHKDVILAYAINGSPLVESDESGGYNGENAFGPLRLAVENTVSAWVKCVVKIVIGEEPQSQFDDISEYEWAREAIENLRLYGIVEGTGDGSFSPASFIKRGDLVLMLCRAFGLDSLADASGCFADVPADSYYYKAIAAAKALGIAESVSAAGFEPEAPISRQDAMALIYKTLAALKTAPAATGDISKFSDSVTASPDAVNALRALVGAGIINGANGRLCPLDSMTRAEAAQAIYNALKEQSEA